MSMILKHRSGTITVCEVFMEPVEVEKLVRELLEAQKGDKEYTSQQAIEAIRARNNGEWDNEQLAKLGELSTSALDIQRILAKTA